MIPARYVMVSSGACLGTAGLALLFAPAESLSITGAPDASPIVGQLLGALYLGFAAANWTARGSMIGGIYARPISTANLTHFFVGAAVLVRGLHGDVPGWPYLAVLGAYCLYAALFTALLLGPPRGLRDHGSDQA